MSTYENFTEKLFNIARIFLVWPSTNGRRTVGFKTLKYICLVYSTITAGSFIYSSKGRFEDIYSGNKSSPAIFSILDQLSHTSSFFSKAASCLYIIFIELQCYLQFFEKLKKLNATLHNERSDCKHLFNFFLLFKTFVASGLIYNAYIYIYKYGIQTYLYFYLKDMEFFQWTLNAFLMFLIILSIRSLFEQFNHKMVDKMELKLKGKFSIYQMRMMFDHERPTGVESNIRNYVLTHYEICKLIDDFNSVFGLNILLLIINCIVELLFNAGLCAVYTLSSVKPLEGLFYDTDLLVPRIHRIVVLLVVPAMLAYACECCMAESNRITPISLIYLNELQALQENFEDNLMKEELTALFHQESLGTQFSAAGFFAVNYAMLGLIIGSTTSYVIVTLELVGI